MASSKDISPKGIKTRLELTIKFIDGLKPGTKEVRYTDAKVPGLTLSVTPATKRKPLGSKLWRLRYLHAGKASMISLGEYPLIGLAEAREKALQAKKAVSQGTNPSHEKRIARQGLGQDDATFQVVAEAWLDDRAANKWVPSHAERNKQRFEGNIFPVFGGKNINALTLTDFHNAFTPVLRRGSLETAQRICAMCIEILSYAGRFGYLRDKSIIFDLQQYKKIDLPKPDRGKFATITEPDAVGELLYKIEEAESRLTYPVALALQIAPYVILRPSELVGGVWDEINLEEAEWHIPKERMKKAKANHVIPLPQQAVVLFKKLKAFSGGGTYMFPSTRSKGAHATPEALLVALRRIKYQPGEFVTHGFRAMASTLLNGNKTHQIKGFDLPPYDKDLIEIQLSHAESNKIRGAYNRRDPYVRIQERRDMLQTYADLLDFLKKQHREK